MEATRGLVASSSVTGSGRVSDASQFPYIIHVHLPSLLDTARLVFRQTSHSPQIRDMPCITSELNGHLLSNHASPPECSPQI